jgi:DNA-binding NarL/FixJ family response regulator
MVASMPVRIVVADDNLLFREGVLRVLGSEPGIEVVGACEDLPSLIEAIERLDPDVVLTDIRMPPSKNDEGIRLALELRRTRPTVGVIVLSQYSEPAYALALLRDGSEGRGYLLKEHVSDRVQLVSAIESVGAGGSVVDPTIIDELIAGTGPDAGSPLAGLTGREREVLGEIAQGKNNAAIAETLVLTKRAVEKHINAIFLKLGLAGSEDVSKRVMATLVFLSEERDRASRSAWSGR